MKKIINKIKSSLIFDIATPLSNKLDIYEYLPIDKVDTDKINSSINFHIRMRFKNIPIGLATFLNKPIGCPDKGFWIGDAYIRIRYRDVGFESILKEKASEFLEKVKIKTNN